jgi:hypothetical protein
MMANYKNNETKYYVILIEYLSSYDLVRRVHSRGDTLRESFKIIAIIIYIFF